ncbi:Hypothetical protein D9617_19g103150 [Elsinoe fawcettii]|nr:Hypothetical protein D9617_19g103150 [Elsinoe fawcettii]
MSPNPTQQAQDESDPFDTLLTLESQYHAEGHALGVADGSKAGRIEGRIFGMQKGFEKFSSMGALAGQCALWEARMLLSRAPANSRITDVSASANSSSVAEAGVGEETRAGNEGGNDRRNAVISPIQHNERLQKHIATLAALTEAASLDTQNTEEAVSDFDDRLKRAEGKVKIIASIVGEAQPNAKSNGEGSKKKDAGSNMEDFSLPNVRGKEI